MLESAFTTARAQGRCAFIPYVMAGDPDRETTADVLNALIDAGSDIIELGVPYSDPVADGPTVAAAGYRALQQGTTLDDVLELAAAFAERARIVLFSYYNPIVQYGLEACARELARCGVAGAIVPDIPLEESSALRSAFASKGRELPMLIAPTTSIGRATRIAHHTTGFLYIVSRLGVTGAGGIAVDDIREQLRALRAVTELPMAVGFGVRHPDDVRALKDVADGIVVGSALLDAMGDARGSRAAARARAFVEPLIAATRR